MVSDAVVVSQTKPASGSITGAGKVDNCAEVYRANPCKVQWIDAVTLVSVIAERVHYELSSKCDTFHR